jgi:hypothetical protein
VDVTGPHRASAAFALGTLLLGLALVRPGAEPQECVGPVVHDAADGGSPRVVCTGDSRTRLEGPVRLLFGLRLDPNREDAATLAVLPGIGSARAAAIVRERERAPFCSSAELQRVPGIGPRIAAGLAPFVGLAPVAPCGAGQVGSSP